MVRWVSLYIFGGVGIWRIEVLLLRQESSITIRSIQPTMRCCRFSKIDAYGAYNGQQRKLPVAWIAVMMFFISSVPQVGADENAWVQTNGPYGGHINALYATPKGVLFAGTGGAGIFRSTDLGDSWTPVNTGLPDPSGDGLYAAVYAQKRKMPLRWQRGVICIN